MGNRKFSLMAFLCFMVLGMATTHSAFSYPQVNQLDPCALLDIPLEDCLEQVPGGQPGDNPGDQPGDQPNDQPSDQPEDQNIPEKKPIDKPAGSPDENLTPSNSLDDARNLNKTGALTPSPLFEGSGCQMGNGAASAGMAWEWFIWLSAAGALALRSRSKQKYF